jgi:pyruvate dehydrogenase E1 component alpha subunit
MTDVELPDDLDAEHAEALLAMMLRIRRFEERCVELYSAAKIRGFLHLYIGQEAVAAGAIGRLRADDAIVATYRDHGHAIAKGLPMSSVMAEMFGRVEGCSRGRGGSMHLFDEATRVYGGNAIVGGGLPIAAGLALADHLQRRDRVTACFFGEGAVAEGEFHETMNLAALWDLPVLFCCENNLYAMGTALHRSEAATDLAVRAAGYGMAAWSVDGMDVLAVDRAAQRAVETIRGGGGPVFLEFRTYRFRAHSMYDPERYREKQEVAEWKQRDPIDRFWEQLCAAGLMQDQDRERLEEEVLAELDEAVAFADAGALEPVEELQRWVHSDASTIVTGPATSSADTTGARS